MTAEMVEAKQNLESAAHSCFFIGHQIRALYAQHTKFNWFLNFLDRGGT